jgi:hypothetical protein
MTATFALTYEDFVEAHKVHRSPARRARLGLGERLLFLWILLASIGVLFVIALVESIVGFRRGTGPTIELIVTGWAVAIAAPWFIYLVIFTFLWYVASGVAGPNERPWIRQMMLVLAVVMLLNTIVATVAAGGPAAQRAQAASTPQQSTSWFATLFPWVTMLFVFWLYIFRYLRGTLPRHWAAQPHLRVPTTLEQTDHGLRAADEHVVHDYRWSAFLKFREGESLFLLYPSHVSYLIVPKRALAERGLVEAFRQLLEQHVASDGPIPARFPLEPMPAPAVAR